MFPESHQEIARAHHADLLRQATQERLGRVVRHKASEESAQKRAAALKLAVGGLRRMFARRRPALRTA
jgi:hypothetical protein